MEAKDVVGIVGGSIGAILGVYNAVTASLEKKRTRAKERERTENPLSLIVTVEPSYHNTNVARDEPVRIELLLSVRVGNVSGEPVSIERPYVEVNEDTPVRFDHHEESPHLLGVGATLTCRRPIDDVLEQFTDCEELGLEPRCRLASGALFAGEALIYGNCRYEGKPKAKRARSRQPVERSRPTSRPREQP